jgi:Calx-beta domain
MLKKILALVFVLSVSVSGVLANSFWETIFGSNQTALVDSVEFSVDTLNVEENGGNAVITVQRTGGGTAAFSVDYATSDNEATQPNDYTLTSGTLNFATGETSKQILVPIINDIDVEVAEGFFAVLSNSTNGVTIGEQNYVYVVIDSDEPFVGIFGTEINETQNATLMLTRGGNNLNQAVTVNYATSNNTAIAGQDYTSQAGTVTFAPNEIEKTVNILTLNDLVVEPIENYNVTLSNPINAGIDPNRNAAPVFIYDDDQSYVYIDANNSYNVAEGNNVVFSFYRFNGDLSLPVSVQFSTADGTATSPLDYNAQSGTVTFAANETFKTISVPTIIDALVEPTENFSCTLSNPSGGTLIYPGSGSAIVNITDASTFSIANATVIEGVTASIDVTRSGGNLSQPATVNFATANGTASAPGDYTAQNGTLNFAANETTKTISIVTIDDTNLESTENLTVTLSNPSSGTSIAGSGISTITITDNEVASTAPRIAFVTRRDGNDEIYGINTDQTYLANISNLATTFDSEPDFNFTNGKFVFVCEGDICTMNADGSNRSILVSGSAYQPS